MNPEDDEYTGILGADEEDYEDLSGNDPGTYYGPASDSDLTDGRGDLRRREAMRGNGLNSFDEGIAGSIVGDLTGASGRVSAARAAAEQANREAMWNRLHEFAPTVDDLAVDYADEAYIDGPGSEWSRDTAEAQGGRGAMADALDAMREWSRGGFTDADEAMMNENSSREAMAARADREAALSMLEARGAGSSGSSLAASLAAGEGAAGRASAANTSMLAAAQQRQYNATRDMAAMGGTMRDMDARERAGREAYNAGETDYARGREGRNTERENRGRESRADAAQQVYSNREHAVAGIDNQYATDVNRRSREEDRAAENNRGLLGAIGELLG